MMSLRCAAMTFGVLLCAFAARATVLEVNVPDGTQTDLTDEQIAAVSSLTAEDEIWKTGGGLLRITKNDGLANFTGTIRIKDGVYQVAARSALGKPGAATFVVESGATMYTDFYTGSSDVAYLAGVRIHLAGNGYGDYGAAAVFGGNTSSDKTAWKGYYMKNWKFFLDDDATISGPPADVPAGRSPSYVTDDSTQAVLDMGGHTLTVVQGFQLERFNSVVDAGLVMCNGCLHEINEDGFLALIVDVPDNTVQTNLTSLQLAALSKLTSVENELRKTGGGTLSLTSADTALSSFKGTIRIRAGVYTFPGGKGYLGTTDGPTIVESGATLKIDGYVNNGDGHNGNYSNEDIRLAGSGAPGMGGALVSSDTSNNVNLGRMSFIADATLFRPSGKATNDPTKEKGNLSIFDNVVDMGGHTVTFVNCGNGGSLFRPEQILNPGHLVFEGGGTYKLPNQSCDLGGSAANTVTYSGDAVLQNSVDEPLVGSAPWTIVAQGNLTFSSKYSFSWDGPIQLAAGKTLTVSSGNLADDTWLRGDISGDASVVVSASADKRVYLGGHNTYTGTTTLKSGDVIFLSKDAAPGWDGGKLVGSGSTTCTVMAFAGQSSSRPNGWTTAELTALAASFRRADGTDRNWGFGVYGDEGDDVSFAMDFAATPCRDMFFRTYGGARGVVEGTYPEAPFAGWFRQTASSNVVYAARTTDGSHELDTLNIGDYDIRFENVGRLWTGHYKYWYLTGAGNNYSKVARLTVGEGACTDYIVEAGKYGRSLYACGNTKNCQAIITLDGGIVSNGIWIASSVGSGSAGQRGCYIQRRGEFSFFNGEGGVVIGGNTNGIGYAEIDGGTMTIGPGKEMVFGGTEAVPRDSTLVHSVYRQNGGDVRTASARLGGGGFVDFVQRGGTFVSEGALMVSSVGNSALTSSNGVASLTFEHEAQAEFQSGAVLAWRHRSTNVVSLATGATLKTPSLEKSRYVANWSTPIMTEGSHLEVDFNGGCLSASASGALFGAEGAVKTLPVDRAVVFAGGAVIGAEEGVVSELNVPLTAPAGKGIASLTSDAFPYACAASGYVVIRGDGVGATATVEFDSTRRNERIIGVRVTNPGTGYTWAEAELFTGGYVANIPLTVTLNDGNAATGGLTKRGAGTIVLNAANTYGGDTVLEAGVLKLGAADALPATSTIVCKGGAIDLNGQSPTGRTFDLSELPFEKGAKYVLAQHCGTGLPTFVGLPEGWVPVNAGGTLKVREPSGVMLIVK